jgi:hypothetical protein
MKIDRQRFLSLVLGMTSPLVGCGGATATEPAPARPSQSVTVAVGPAPTAECIDWSPSGACLAYGVLPGAVVAPTAEAMYAPTGECNGWDDSGTCVEWEGDTYAPVDECTQWDPTGECIRWG